MLVEEAELEEQLVSADHQEERVKEPVPGAFVVVAVVVVVVVVAAAAFAAAETETVDWVVSTLEVGMRVAC